VHYYLQKEIFAIRKDDSSWTDIQLLRNPGAIYEQFVNFRILKEFFILSFYDKISRKRITNEKEELLCQK